MSWKVDKFQPLRDRAQATVGSPVVAVLQARVQQIDSVTSSLRPEPLYEDTDTRISGNRLVNKHWAAKLHADIVDRSFLNACMGAAGTKASAPSKGYSSQAMQCLAIQSDRVLLAKLKEFVAKAREQELINEVTRELSGEPTPDPFANPLRSMRHRYGFNVAKPSSAVCLDGV